jgi:hypothetical protein
MHCGFCLIFKRRLKEQCSLKLEIEWSLEKRFKGFILKLLKNLVNTTQDKLHDLLVQKRTLVGE